MYIYIYICIIHIIHIVYIIYIIHITYNIYSVYICIIYIETDRQTDRQTERWVYTLKYNKNIIKQDLVVSKIFNS